MGKKSKKSEPTKAERKALKAREAEIRAELERRAAKKAAKKKAAKKGGKKGKTPKPLDVEPMVITAEAEAYVAGDPTPEEIAAAAAPAEEATHPHIAHLEEVGRLNAIVNDDAAKKSERKAAKARLAELRAEGERLNAERDARRAAKDAESDEDIKARVQAKRAARDAAAADKPGSPERLAKMQADVAAGRKIREAGVTESDTKVEAALAGAVEAVRQAVDVVETETGRIFEAGEAVAAEAPEEFAKPSDATPELEEGRNGYKIIMLDADGKPDPRKVRQLTRVTTFVGNIDDETNLKLWEKRLLAEGISTNPEEFVPRVNDIVHRREVAIAKGRKADRKGKLDIGELAIIEETANKAAKDALNALVEEALEAAGRNDKADAGTNLHALAELSDAEGIDAVRVKYEAGEISATDLASIEAYAARMARLGAKVIESEAVVVNDSMGYAGRLDRIIMAKLPEITVKTAAGEFVRPADKRSRRYVTDIKSGRIDYGAGKISRQLAAYALGDLYDIETGARSRHSAATDIALVFHLPQGAGTCSVHAVDIKSGAILLRLSAEVRRARNTGKKTIDTSVDIADPAPGDDAPEGGE